MINNPKLQSQIRKQTPRKTLRTQFQARMQVQAQTANPKRQKTKWIQKTTPQPNHETKEAVNVDIVISTQPHYNKKANGGLCQTFRKA